MGAGHLKVGDKLKQADGTLGEVRYVNTIQEARTMYNLEVEEAHTFYVGTQGWLVHNGGNTNSLLTFYTVQSPEDAARLRSGGTPWPPNSMERSNMGQGVYAWSSSKDADTYAARLRTKGANVEIVKLQITKEAFAKLNGIDLTKMSGDAVDEWMAKYSHYGDALPHGKDYVARPANLGVEHYFSPDAFKKFWVGCP